MVSPTFRSWSDQAYGYTFGDPDSGSSGTTSSTANNHPTFTTSLIDYLRSKLPTPLRLNVVRVWEKAPPENAAPVEWLLYTTEPVSTAEEVAAVVDIYRARWLVEECNKLLKSGCLIGLFLHGLSRHL